jgi:hypothetical protein
MIRKNVAEILDQHVTFELEAIDRMYLTGHVPSQQHLTGAGELLRANALDPGPLFDERIDTSMLFEDLR